MVVEVVGVVGVGVGIVVVAVVAVVPAVPVAGAASKRDYQPAGAGQTHSPSARTHARIHTPTPSHVTARWAKAYVALVS